MFLRQILIKTFGIHLKDICKSTNILYFSFDLQLSVEQQTKKIIKQKTLNQKKKNIENLAKNKLTKNNNF